MLTETLKNWVFKMDNQYNLGLCKSMGIDAEFDIDAEVDRAREPKSLHYPFQQLCSTWEFSPSRSIALVVS